MMFPGLDLTTLVTITLAAATVNGAPGYGLSSLTVPVRVCSVATVITTSAHA